MEGLDAFRLSELISLRLAITELKNQDITTYLKNVSWENILNKIDRALELRTNNIKL